MEGQTPNCLFIDSVKNLPFRFPAIPIFRFFDFRPLRFSTFSIFDLFVFHFRPFRFFLFLAFSVFDHFDFRLFRFSTKSPIFRLFDFRPFRFSTFYHQFLIISFNSTEQAIVRPECTSDSECSNDKACINERCQNPCADRNPCAGNADCRVSFHRPLCYCPSGWGGDPQVQCFKRKFQTKLQKNQQTLIYFLLQRNVQPIMIVHTTKPVQMKNV